MDNKPLVRALLYAFTTFDDATDKDIERDYAIKCSENLNSYLVGMTGAEREDFVRILEELAVEAADTPAWAEYVRSVPVMIWGPREYWHLDA